jgi:hypothetical protein
MGTLEALEDRISKLEKLAERICERIGHKFEDVPTWESCDSRRATHFARLKDPSYELTHRRKCVTCDTFECFVREEACTAKL